MLACREEPKGSGGGFGHVDLLSCPNSMVAMHKFITERVLFV